MKKVTGYQFLTTIDFDSAVVELIEGCLPSFTPNKVMAVNIMFSATNYDTDESYYEDVKIIAYRASNYTFIGIPLDNVRFLNEVTKIEMKSYHDSCWTADGVSRIIRGIANKIMDKIKDDSKFSFHTGFGSTPVEFIDGNIKNIDFGSRTAILEKIKQ